MTNIAILGFGTVGSGAVEVITQNKKIIESRLGTEVNIKYILDLREFPGSPFEHLIVHDFQAILADPEVSVVAEMMGGSHPAYDFSKACLEAGKSVVTSNKEVVASFGAELLEIAKAHGVAYLFEASVGGGIPIIRPMCNDLASNNITAVSGILNGTTNYILTKMDTDGAAFDDVLKDAQKKGYAEANPTADVEGIDAARKIVILAALAFGKIISPTKIYTEGITNITTDDINLAKEYGCAIKLIGYTKEIDGKVLCMVSPRIVPASNPLSSISDVFNGILVSADMVGEVMFYGPGAGKLPTASAVCADIVDIIAHRDSGIKLPEWKVADDSDIADVNDYSCRRLFIFDGNDGASVAKVFSGAELRYIDGKISFISDSMTDKEAADKASACALPLVKTIRVLD